MEGNLRMNRSEIISILRKPHGRSESVVRRARLAAADELERLSGDEQALAEVESFLQEHYGLGWKHFRAMVEEELSPAPLTGAEREHRAEISRRFYEAVKPLIEPEAEGSMP